MRLVYWLLEVLVELRAFHVTAVGICKVENGDLERQGKYYENIILLPLLYF